MLCGDCGIRQTMCTPCETDLGQIEEKDHESEHG